MYPVILNENKRMGFARIGKTRITYMRPSVTWTDRLLEIEGIDLTVEIEFPETETERRNIVVKLENKRFGSCQVELLFTGDSVHLVGKKDFARNDDATHTGYNRFKELMEWHLFDEQKGIDEFFHRFFTPFTFDVLGRGRRNIRSFLTNDHYRLSVIQFQENPFLLITMEG